MIRIDLVDNTASIKHIEFCVVPVTEQRDFTCIPEAILPLRSVMRLSRELKAGRTFGRFGKYVWYRLISAPVDMHKKPMNDRQ